MTDRKVRPRLRLLILAVAVVVGVTATILVSLWVNERNKAQETHDCEFIVHGRADNRAMWVYLLNTQVDDPTDPKVVAFKDALNRLLPELHCVDRNPVPVAATPTTEE